MAEHKVTVASGGTYALAVCLVVAVGANNLVLIPHDVTSSADGRYFPVSPQDQDGSWLYRKFDALSTRWLDDTAFLSSTTEIIAHPAYLEIIGLGQAVIPYLLEALDKRPGLWFYALASIARVNPISPEDAGNYDRMRAAWIAWGRERGYV